jgi:16S rRNA C967 or C1407 C5-methylase (RsmB/RsmF family)
MIPLLLLDVKPGMKILDTCAVPGSKTAQLLEFMLLGMTRKERALNPGFVLANDADNHRANLLSHQSS